MTDLCDIGHGKTMELNIEKFFQDATTLPYAKNLTCEQCGRLEAYQIHVTIDESIICCGCYFKIKKDLLFIKNKIF